MAEKLKCPHCPNEAELGSPPNFDPLGTTYRNDCPNIMAKLNDRGARGGSAVDVQCDFLDPLVRTTIAKLRAAHRAKG